MNSTSSRILYFDYLRIAAVFCVILLHIQAVHIWGNIGTPVFFVYDFFNSITRWCVPVFVMISGALFLDPERDIQIGRLHKKNLLRIITAFAFWSLLYALVDYLEGMRLRDAVFNIARGHYHLWYLLMLAGLYLVVPILRKVTESKKLTEYFLILWFVLILCLKTIIYLAGFLSHSYSDLFSEISDKLNFCVAGGYSGYFVIGYYLNRYDISKRNRILIYLMGLAGLIATFLLPLLYYNLKGNPTINFNENLTVNIFFLSVAVFVFFKYNIKNLRTNIIVSTLSECSFGIYLVHLLILEFFERHLGFDSGSFWPGASIPVLAISVFLISFIITFILRKIPFLNKYVV